MQIETIKLDPRIARIHYLDYRKRCAANREKRRSLLVEKAAQLDRDVSRVQLASKQLDKEDEQLLRAYRALYRGQQLLDLPKTMASCGLDAQKFPRFAVCRADATKCYLAIDGNTLYLSATEIRSFWRMSERRKAMPFGQLMPIEARDENWRRHNNFKLRAEALVPSIPPHLRPDDLSKYFILWEAEWTAKAPVDPILLSKVNERLYAVVAQWDLTPLEQSVLEGRL